MTSINQEIGRGKAPEQKPEVQNLNLTSFALNLGFSISIPLVGLALLGRSIDVWQDTSPLFLLIGILLSLFISVAIIYRKVKDVLR